MKRSTLRRHTPRTTKYPVRRSFTAHSKIRLTAGSRSKRFKRKASAIPEWAKAIPESQSHGSGTLQKRLWRLKSDYVRIRDFTAYGGKDVASPRILATWQEGHAGHLKPYSRCNGMFKFNELNIHLQSANTNKWPTRDDWAYYENELKERYGDTIILLIETTNRDCTDRIHSNQVLEEMMRTLRLIGTLEIKPVYYERAVDLLNEKTALA